MKTLLVLISVFIFATSLNAVTRVKGYIRKNGTYVAPHLKSERDYTKFNNYSTKGNINPFTGKAGTKDPFKKRKRKKKR